ncbi:hypothetical protein [Neisseria lactamica]|nr:hypothetical protein [Neisseria lactamica]
MLRRVGFSPPIPPIPTPPPYPAISDGIGLSVFHFSHPEKRKQCRLNAL